MYNEYFGLAEAPFSIAPDPRYLYMSEEHREALAHLLFGVNSDGGFVLLTGEVGTGKTTVCRCLLEQVPDDCDVAFILNPKLSVQELLSTICDELCIPYPEGTSSVKVFVDLINAHLLDSHSKGRKTVLIIDEAQNLSTEVLEQMRLLTNLETNRCKLLQIILLGQPELRVVLSRPELRQLSQRIIARYHLLPLQKKEVAAYVKYRLDVAGSRDQLFDDGALEKLFGLSGGIPRLINVICDRALLGAYAQSKQRVDRKILMKAAREVFGEPRSQGLQVGKALKWAIYGLVLMGSGAVLATSYYSHHSTKTRLPVVEAPQVKPRVEVVHPKPMEPARFRKPVPPVGAPPEEVRKTSETVQTMEREALAKEKRVSPPPGTLSKWAAAPNPRSEAISYQALFKIWGASFKPERNVEACLQGEAQGLRCMSGLGGLDELSKLNRPAVLKFFNAGGQQFFALLSSLHGDTAIFKLGDETITVPVHEIASWWRGDYTLLWRMPPAYRNVIQTGDRGPAVDWVRAQLAKARGTAVVPRENGVFDAAMVAEVKKFQLANGLQPDGIVGPQTLIRLGTQTGDGVPLLVGEKKDR